MRLWKLCSALVIAAAVPSAASAQTPEFFPLGQGSFPSLSSTWQANAVQPNTVLLDLYDDEGILYQTYSTLFEPQAKKAITATGQRPLGLPTTAALVGGATGKRIKTVKVFFRDAPMQKFTTVLPPPEWGFTGRFFAAGAVVGEASAGATQVVTQIKGLDGRGRRLTVITNVFTNPF